MNVLVTGGAGYIGSVTVRQLMLKHKVVILDNLCKGHKQTVPRGVKFVKGDIGDAKLVARTLKKNKIKGIVHFAAYIEAGESEEKPLKYFENNLQKSVVLIKEAAKAGVTHFVYSSSAAVYGNPKRTPIREEDPKEPTNIYGLTKLLTEHVLEEYAHNHPMKVAAMRYFNAAGADGINDLGEDHSPETHLIPLILKTAMGKRKSISIFGTNYPTKDGTCIRDYIHVTDLAAAHVKALTYLNKTKNKFTPFNLGSGKHYTVKEVIVRAGKVSGKNIVTKKGARRKGDPTILIASNAKAKKLLGWKPENSKIGVILTDAWNWHDSHPDGYK